ncbi:MAG: hypothetical protein NT086_19905 [Proteobacteria bacterium]|nr:hypothetical protein [Pseudomonadota bacterium]
MFKAALAAGVLLLVLLIYSHSLPPPAAPEYRVSCYDENNVEVAHGRWSVHECLVFLMKRKRDE